MHKKLGILGGGQLGRMSALAAARLGVEVFIYDPDPECPAAKVSAGFVNASYNDKKALSRFASLVDIITYEFENIPIETLKFLQNQNLQILPDPSLLEISQHRVQEKRFINNTGIPTAGWQELDTPSPDIIKNIMTERQISECIIKTCRFGYDGKGQIIIRSDDSDSVIESGLESLGNGELILEEKIDFSAEISVIIARDKLGQSAIYGPVMNEHRNHILFRSTIPANIPEDTANQALRYTRHLSDAVDLVGVMALEMFVTSDGKILANEIAPRTHNSGHWSIDACACSQFENHIRTVCGMHIGYPARHSDAVMVNFIGKSIYQLGKFMEIKSACVHDYGKNKAREGRKMGHVTILHKTGEISRSDHQKTNDLIESII